MHTPRKRFGQNFLRDQYVIDQIIQAIDPRLEDYLVEIGPGLGALTNPLAKLTKHLNIIELDRDLAADLKEKFKNTAICVYQQDVLTVDFAALLLNMESHDDSFQERSTVNPEPRKLRIVGNLPYNISTPVIFHLLKQITCIKDMYFMLQKEVVDRLAANVGDPNYGRLSIMVQYWCEITPLFLVEPEAFFPIPKVDSQFVKLRPHTATIPCINFDQFTLIVREAFNHRRKTLRNSLKKIVSAEDIEKQGINPQSRPQELSVEDFVRLSNSV